MIDQGYRGSDSFATRDRWEKLAGAIIPDAKYLVGFGWECRIDYPLDVLQQRVASLGRESKYVKEWLGNQDKVLEACSQNAAASISLPEAGEIHPALKQMQQDDRAYQEASIAYYRDKEKALQLFHAIGASGSPHKAAARYNIANLLANGKKPAEARAEAKAILADPSLASVHAITKELLGYIANLEDTAESWSALINDTIATIEQPLASINASEISKREYSYALYDLEFAGVRGKDDDWWLDGKLPEDATISKALFDASRARPIVLWMMAGQSVDKAYRAGPWSLIGQKWQARTAATIDKALAVTPSAAALPPIAAGMLAAAEALPDDSSRSELWVKAHAAIAAAGKSCGDDPQTAAAGYLLAHAVRLSAMSGHFDEAIAELEKVPFKTSAAYYDRTLSKLAEYLLGQGKLAEARMLRDRLLTPDFLASLPEGAKPAATDRLAAFMGWIAEDEAHWKAALALHSRKSSNLVFNFLSAKSLWTLADDAMFSAAERGLLARTAWTRGYARGITQSEENTAKLYELNPALRDTAGKVAADYPKANDVRRRLLTILRSPRFGILVGAQGLWNGFEDTGSDFNGLDNYDANDKNWWCPFQPDRQLAGLRAQFNEALGLDYFDQYGNSDLGPVYDPEVRGKIDANREAVLKSHPMIKTVDWKELAALSQMGSAPKTLTQSAIRWGKASGGGDGAPEALALAVRATRYGCRWSGRHGSYSRAAHDLLQAKFKDTPWARQTPYWFDCRREEWNETGTARLQICEAKVWPKQPPLK